MKIKRTDIEIGGMLRCCYATIMNYINTYAEQDIPTKGAMIIDCMYESERKGSIRLDTDGIWRWNSEAEGIPFLRGAR